MDGTFGERRAHLFRNFLCDFRCRLGGSVFVPENKDFQDKAEIGEECVRIGGNSNGMFLGGMVEC